VCNMVKIGMTWEQHIGPILRIRISERTFGLCFCHRMPERSIPCLGLERYLCSRCIGILIGGILGFIAWKVGVSVPAPAAVLCSIPMAIDGGTQLLGLRESTNTMRLITGFLFGLSLNALGAIL
jgi:uncharacterized membrane protein